MAAAAFHLKIISPASVIVDDHVPEVEIPGVEGDFGVLPGHSPLFSMIRPGVISVKLPDGARRDFFATSGYADVTPESCTVISDHIQELATITSADAEAALTEAKTLMAKAETMAERQFAEKALLTAEARTLALRTAGH